MTRFLFGIAFSVFLTFPPHTSARQTETAYASQRNPAFAGKIHIKGVKDAGKLNHHLYRGTQPNEKGLEELKKRGVTTIVDLRGEFTHNSKHERKQTEELGMKYILIPGNGWSPPSDKQMAEFFAAIAERPQQTIFIHCWLGGDRTGVFLAAYRIAFEHWTSAQALAEMHEFHFKSFWHPAMKDYIRDFPNRLATSEALAPYRSIHESAAASLPPANH